MLDHTKLDACPTLPARLTCAAQLPSHHSRSSPHGPARSGAMIMVFGLASGRTAVHTYFNR